jgi:hypothetical protein
VFFVTHGLSLLFHDTSLLFIFFVTNVTREVYNFSIQGRAEGLFPVLHSIDIVI